MPKQKDGSYWFICEKAYNQDCSIKKGTKIDVGGSDITSINPGKRDHVYIGKFEGKSQYIQKQYLLRKLRDV